jgi:hypothetical protein
MGHFKNGKSFACFADDEKFVRELDSWFFGLVTAEV